eukprot:gene50820-68034_t
MQCLSVKTSHDGRHRRWICVDCLAKKIALAAGAPIDRRHASVTEKYALARADGAVCPVSLWNGKRAWLVTRQAEIRELLSDDKRFSGAM